MAQDALACYRGSSAFEDAQWVLEDVAVPDCCMLLTCFDLDAHPMVKG